MFVLVMPYGADSIFFTGKAPVYDTKDLTIEYIDIKEAVNAGIQIEGYYNRSVYYITALYDALRNNPVEKDPMITMLNESTEYETEYVIDGVVVTITEDIMTSGIASDNDSNEIMLEVNGEQICFCESAVLVYAFKYADCCILRLNLSEYSGGGQTWFSVAVDKIGKVISYWDERMQNVKNKNFALKVDMTGGF